MNIKPNVRLATLKDLPTLKAFEQGIIEAERPFNPRLSANTISYYDLKAKITSDTSCVVIAEYNGSIAASGFAQLLPAKPYLDHTTYAHFGFMYVSPAFRGRGFNQLIMSELLTWCKYRDIDEISLDVYAGNDSAIKAYEKAGFTPHLLTMRLDKPAS